MLWESIRIQGHIHKKNLYEFHFLYRSENDSPSRKGNCKRNKQAYMRKTEASRLHIRQNGGQIGADGLQIRQGWDKSNGSPDEPGITRTVSQERLVFQSHQSPWPDPNQGPLFLNNCPKQMAGTPVSCHLFLLYIVPIRFKQILHTV